MELVKRLTRQLAASVEEQARQCLVRMMVKVLLLSAAALLVAVGAIFLFTGLYLYLAQLYQDWLAALLTGGVMLVLSLPFLLASVRSRPSNPGGEPPPRESPEKPGDSERDSATELGEMAGEMLSRSNLRATDAAMIALVAGIALGRSGKRRDKSSSEKED